MLAKTPWDDDAAFAELLTQWDVYVLPGYLAKLPGHVRISLSAATAEGALPGFAAALAHARAHPPPAR